GANLLVFKLRRLGFSPVRYRRLPFWAWGITWNFIQHLLLWKFRLRMRTMVELEWIIWRTSKVFVFGNAYNVVLARKPVTPSPRPPGADAARPPDRRGGAGQSRLVMMEIPARMRTEIAAQAAGDAGFVATVDVALR